MQYIEWDTGFNIGIKEIDTQHQALVNIINTLAEAIENDANVDTFQRCF